ncbi:hypothetical protein [Microbispora sp. NPDC049633]|uniref:hypothetical protein n=1 Tax=Microbispora sp. NPDC049633 TaxID=3154355 RepID=UPI00344372EF
MTDARDITIYRQTFLPEDVRNGDITYRETVEDVWGFEQITDHADTIGEWVYTENPEGVWVPASLPAAAADILLNEGLSEIQGDHQFYDPDGSYVTDYRTGERCQVSGFLHNWPDAEITEVNEIIQRRIRETRGY